MTSAQRRTPEERAKRRVMEYMGLMWHVAAYVIVNAFLWTLDFIQGGGLEWAYWATIPWGLGLAFHVVAYMLDESGFQGRRYNRYLEEERRKDQEGGL